MTEKEPVRSSSPELTAMTLPKLKEVASQLGIEGAAKMKKDQLASAIADLQAKNREAAKAEREEKMHKQKELNKQIIEEWNQATSKEIKENPSKFFNNDQA